jgi:hypothetical protein
VYGRGGGGVVVRVTSSEGRAIAMPQQLIGWDEFSVELKLAHRG